MFNAEHYSFTWNSGHMVIDIEIAYTPNLHIYDHLGIHAVRPEGTKLPISETGYRSHYGAAGSVAAVGGPVAAVRMILDEAALSPEWQEYVASQRQASLF